MDLTDSELGERIASRNHDTFASLERQLRTTLGVIPFVGAGLSASIKLQGNPSRFPQWGDLLRNFAKGFAFEDEIEKRIGGGDYEGAASVIQQNRPYALKPGIRQAFNRKIADEQVLRGAVSYLPLLASGPVITTNYDKVLERAFEVADRRFETIVAGPLEDAIVAAIHGNERALIKIHGDFTDGRFRVLTAEDYEAAYGSMKKDPAQSNPDIGSLTWLLFTNRPLLFLGCSLERDRTVSALGAIRKQLPGLTHYAVLEAERSREAWEKRQQHLEALGIQVLWFMPGQFDEIEGLLRTVIESASVRPLDPLPAAQRPRKPAEPAPDLAAVLASLPKEDGAKEAEEFRVQLDLISGKLRDGRLGFFLGAYAALKPDLLGDTFYQNLAEKFNCPALRGGRAAIAGYIIRRHGYAELLKEVRAAIGQHAKHPSMLHRFIAALPAFLRAGKNPAQLCILTTNYDTLMEQALIEAGESFHQLYYVNDGGSGVGCFIERSSHGMIRQVERPENLRHLDSSTHLFVKLNGGLACHGDLEEQVSIIEAHFERLAARIPSILPQYLRTELQRRSFLFLGHGLAEPDVRALIEHAAGDDRIMRSWAVQARPTEPTYLREWQDDVEHWPMFGLQVLEADLSRFSAALCRRIAEGARAPTSSNVPPPGKRGPDGIGGIVFVSYPNDIAPPIMKQIVSRVIAGGLQVWLWDPLPFSFTEEESGKIVSVVHGEPWLEATHQAARNADAVLFLISQRTLRSEFQAHELAIGLKRKRVVPCIVDEDLKFDQLPTELQKLYIGKVTEQSLSTDKGKAEMNKLVAGVVRMAKVKREPTGTE